MWSELAGRVSFQFVRPAVGLLAARWQDICLPHTPYLPLPYTLPAPSPFPLRPAYTAYTSMRASLPASCAALPATLWSPVSVCLCVCVCVAASVVVAAVVTLLVVVVLTVVACFRFSTEIKKFSIFRGA